MTDGFYFRLLGNGSQSPCAPGLSLLRSFSFDSPGIPSPRSSVCSPACQVTLPVTSRVIASPLASTPSGRPPPAGICVSAPASGASPPQERERPGLSGREREGRAGTPFGKKAVVIRAFKYRPGGDRRCFLPSFVRRRTDYSSAKQVVAEFAGLQQKVGSWKPRHNKKRNETLIS